MTHGWHDGTRCIQAGHAGGDGRQPVAGAPLLAGPVFAAPYHMDAADPHRADFYGREGNPTWRALEAAIGDLDGGYCVLFPSGMAAITTLMRSVLRPGAAVVLPSDGYYQVRKFAHGSLSAGSGVEVREVPTPGPWPDGVFEGARLVLLETPSNPGMDVCDIAKLATAAHAAGALVAVDNTTASPLGQRPLELGADLVVASDSKALTGHSDLILGHVSTLDAELAAALVEARGNTGAVAGPFEAWLAHRSLGTLDLRLGRQAENAGALARLLAGHPAVREVRWPGLPEDPAHAVASKQMRRFGGVLCFELSSAEAVRRFVDASRLVLNATSFGGLHTTADRRAQWGDAVSEGFVRLSAGCEDTEDLVCDVRAALDALSDG
ncbi:MAG TPA: cystathionine gamma-lyase [Pseudonocardiaceae bacterium]